MKGRGAIESATRSFANLMALLSKEDSARLSELIQTQDYCKPPEFAIHSLLLPAGTAYIVHQHLSSLSEREEFVALAAMLSNQAYQMDEEPLEICCTGKGLEKYARSTWPVLMELLSGAQKEIVIAGYDVRPGFRPIFEVIERKATEGVAVTMLVDGIDKNEDLRGWLEGMPSNVKAYHRRKHSMGQEKMHIKCVVVDDGPCLTGSTNLTFLGLKRNMEMNVVIKDKETIKRIKAILYEVRKGLEPFHPPRDSRAE